MKRYRYRDYQLILAEDNYQNYLLLRDNAGVCIIIAADLPEEDIDEIQWEFETDCLTDEELDYDGLPFTDLTSFNKCEIIA